MAFLKQEARVIERFRIIEVAQAESVTEAARRSPRGLTPGHQAAPEGTAYRSQMIREGVSLSKPSTRLERSYGPPTHARRPTVGNRVSYMDT